MRSQRGRHTSCVNPPTNSAYGTTLEKLDFDCAGSVRVRVCDREKGTLALRVAAPASGDGARTVGRLALGR